ncbi:VapE domain-containing protein [Devosia sp. XGJD_8]|uniref:VapE domain-containing protein n=1 Tax=Devosia sp. XGJD_8 TaxID=3391187 RepID=UPI0039849D41
MANHNNRMLSWAEGRGANLGKATNKKGSWLTLRQLLGKPTKTNEKHKVYLKMSRDEQLHLKSINGWISGAQCEGGTRNLRSVKPRDVASFDMDYPWESFFPDMESGIHWLASYECVVLSTRSSTEEKPRYRVIMPMARFVQPDEWMPLCRIISFRIDYEQQPMEQVDVVSSRRAQMMFLPTISKDQPYQFLHNQGSVIDPDEMFAWYEENHGDYRDLSALPLYKGEEGIRKHADKAEDPWLKPGVIGDWCRAWPIEDLIAEFLSDIYDDRTEHGAKPRYTYTGGSAANGAVVEDNGRFLYSHHGTDPVGEQLVNAWDLYRIHKFGMLDESVYEAKVSMMDRPSSKRMREFVETDERYRAERTKSRYDLGAILDDSEVGDEDFEDGEEEVEEDLRSEYTDEAQPEPDTTADDEWGFSEADLGPADADEPPKDKPKAKKPGKGKNPKAKTWFGEELEVNKNGDVVSSVHNVAAILYNDPRFYGKLRWDEFTGVVRVFDNIASRSDNIPTLICQDKLWGDRWTQMGHATIRAILATPNGAGKVGYGLSTVAKRDIADGVILAAMRNRYHPIKNYLEAEEWDGQARVEGPFVDYLGLADTPYARETAKLVLIASVARIYEPGTKFDYAPVLQGDQGIRKSTFIRTLYTSRWFGEVACDLGDVQKVAEAISGKWGNELPEMAAQNKSEVTDAKAFLSRQEDTVRMAYAREVSVIKRQSVFWGTTNEDIYLKDRTGNRRFWPLHVTTRTIDTGKLAEELPQLWAEALELYSAMRAMYPRVQHEDLPLMLTGSAEAEAKHHQEGVRQKAMDEDWTAELAEHFDHPVNLVEFANGYDINPAEFAQKGQSPEDTWVVRQVFRSSDAAAAVGLDWPIKNGLHGNALTLAVQNLSGWEKGHEGKRYRRWKGKATTWFHRIGASPEDLDRGFVIVQAPDFKEAEFADNYGFTDEDLGPEDPDEEIDNLV